MRMRSGQTYLSMSQSMFRPVNQDRLIADSMRAQDLNAKKLRDDASKESAINARYGLALRNYLNMVTGYPEYLR